MHHNTQRYHYDVIWSEEDQEYVGLCTEFPSLSWLDASAAAALHGIQQLIVSCVDDLHDQGEPIPEPLSATSVPKDKKIIIRLYPTEVTSDYPVDSRWNHAVSSPQPVSMTP